MKYVGSKSRIAKHILPIMLQGRKKDQVWVEPFVGGGNMIDKVDGKRIGIDINNKIIALLTKLRDGWLPLKNITIEEFKEVKLNQDKFDDHYVAYIATQLSYGSVWFCAYRRDNTGKRNYSLEAYNNVMKQSGKLKGIDFVCADYREFTYPENSLIYCDPVYRGSDIGAYRGVIQSFDNDIFWDWCRMMSGKGHDIYVSEYTAPDDFICIWEKEIGQKINNNVKTTANSEKLFVYKGGGIGKEYIEKYNNQTDQQPLQLTLF